MASRRAPTALVFALLTLAASFAGGRSVFCAFASTQSNAGDSFASAADFYAPATSARTIGKNEGGVAGFVRPGGRYRLYADAEDRGNPPSGIDQVRADLSSLTSGQDDPKLSSGSYEFGGVSYGLRSGNFKVAPELPAGTYEYSVTLTDGDGNSATEGGYTVTVDDTPPQALDVQAANVAGGTPARIEEGDSVVFTFSEPPDPDSVLSEWGGSPVGVTVRLRNHGTPGSQDDELLFYDGANGKKLQLGGLDLGRVGFTTANLTFGEEGTPSTMTLSGDTITVTMGTASGPVTTAAGPGAMVWLPSSKATDRAGNELSTESVTESGAEDLDF